MGCGDAVDYAMASSLERYFLSSWESFSIMRWLCQLTSCSQPVMHFRCELLPSLYANHAESCEQLLWGFVNVASYVMSGGLLILLECTFLLPRKECRNLLEARADLVLGRLCGSFASASIFLAGYEYQSEMMFVMLLWARDALAHFTGLQIYAGVLVQLRLYMVQLGHSRIYFADTVLNHMGHSSACGIIDQQEKVLGTLCLPDSGGFWHQLRFFLGMLATSLNGVGC